MPERDEPATDQAVLRASFAASYPYGLDRFQLEAMDVIDAGRSVLVTAPTGAGKTVVAEYAVHLALARGVRAFYTTPIKALSNQKYGDLVARHGAARVGLLTGDNSINASAPVVVMTTEVLRNMIHSGRAPLAALGFVVLDEVHFLENPYRGGVWEEVILGAPEQVRLVCLSATVENASELAAWIGRVRGGTGIVREEHRPVALHDLFAIGERSAERVHLLPVFVRERPNPRAAELDGMLVHHGASRSRSRSRVYRPRRVEMAERLAEAELLPAIFFVFSRAGCDDAVRRCVEGGLRLSAREDREAIRRVADDHVEALSDSDLAVLGYGQFLTALESGIAAHHAGMVPPFREAVEECFSKALVKVVFATETLAVGVNMPARSVVIEELTKFSGAAHAALTSGEYTQLTGRAGRRGIDDVGYAVVVASPFHDFEDVAELAGSPGRALTSSFRPTYNLAISLVRRFERGNAYQIVTSSFAQFLSEEDLGSQLTRVLEMLEARGYVAGWSATPAGEMLAGIYHEADLLIAESLRAGLLDALDPAAMAAVVSGFCYEPRRERDRVRGVPPGDVGERLVAISELSGELAVEEAALALPVMRGADPGFALLAQDWARGRDLRRLLARSRGGAEREKRPPARRGAGRRSPAAAVMTGGDFVRTTKQVIDLLRQLAVVAPREETRRSAAEAARRLLRGVVAASSEVRAPASKRGGESATSADKTIHAASSSGP